MVQAFYESINFPQQHGLALSPVRIRYFIFIGYRSVYTDPHQSPIRFKAIVFYAQCLKHGPWSIRTPENLQCHAVFNYFYHKSYGY